MDGWDGWKVASKQKEAKNQVKNKYIKASKRGNFDSQRDKDDRSLN